jgi:hypothetical protein
MVKHEPKPHTTHVATLSTYGSTQAFPGVPFYLVSNGPLYLRDHAL